MNLNLKQLKKINENNEIEFNDKEMLCDFLGALLVQISFSNTDAHELNLKQSIVEQIFQYLDPNN